MAKPGRAKFSFIKSKVIPKKLVNLQSKRDRKKVVNDASAKKVVTSVVSHITSIVSNLSHSTDSDEHIASTAPSVWSTSVPIPPSSQRRMPKQNVRRSVVSISTLPSKKSSSAVKRKLSYIDEEPFHLYKLRKLAASAETQLKIVHSHPHLTSSTDSVEEASNQSDGDKVDSEMGNTSDHEDQMTVSSDSNIRMRFDILQTLRNIPDWDELSDIGTSDQNQGIDKKSVEMQAVPGSELEQLQIPLARRSLSSSVESLIPSETNYEAPSSQNDDDVQGPEIPSPSGLESNDESDWRRLGMQFKSSHVATFKDITSVSRSSIASLNSIRTTLSIGQLVQSYLDGLIEKVVDIFVNTEYLRKKNLDKSKLMNRLLKEVDDHHWESRDNNWLTKRLTEHHLRRFKYSLVTPSSRSHINESHRRRYMGALNELDHWLHRTRQAEQMHLAERERLLAELERMQLEDNEKVERLEEVFRSTILRGTQPSERLRLVTETALKHMRAKRDALSATRLILIIKQHDNSYTKKKVDEIEAISGEVKLETYLSADNDVQQMVTTLNHKNAELERMCTLVKTKIHTISHLRCRRKLLNRRFREAKDELRERRKRQIALRDEVYNCNLTHNKLLDQIKEVRREGGIMCYPKLLADFDRTEKFIAIKQESIEELKTQYDNLLRRIDKIELKILESRSD
ncbi:uncharacterized protein LOC6731985 isoform X3 [Drosophila simulans]|uniref:Uncharacterized protein, isoform D n=1 Tax=Drosophila simulans TaxID=7240 RepID=A0A0J9R0D9_DROSI|nr:uncharacterized protein LOC6731985 isoform X3 [Drosophila simulans]KMY89762.1 uncharacterized protein Dsimw501_GD23780, isoform D [Drosophila simulans]